MLLFGMSLKTEKTASENFILTEPQERPNILTAGSVKYLITDWIN